MGSLVACNREPDWKLKNISGLMPNLKFTLTDSSGHTVRERDFLGKITLLYFGYTHCPDICPTTLAKLAQTIRALGTDAAAIQVLFISVDPNRDTPRVLREYSRAFSSQIIGLSGQEQELRDLNKRFRLTYSLGTPDAWGEYDVTHSSAVFIFDKQGASRLLILQSDPVQAVTADLQRLLKSS